MQGQTQLPTPERPITVQTTEHTKVTVWYLKKRPAIDLGGSSPPDARWLSPLVQEEKLSGVLEKKSARSETAGSQRISQTQL